MCILVVVGKYHCHHHRSHSHGIPDEFIRQCDDSANFLGCDLVPNEEDIPWLCPNCHWDYVQQNLAPLWQQTTVTKCRVLQEAQMFPAEPSYQLCQKEADHLEDTFRWQQQALDSCAISYHELRDQTLRSFLGENFRICLAVAHHAHRPWTLSHLREPFIRATLDTDVAADASCSADTINNPRSPDMSAVPIYRAFIDLDADLITFSPSSDEGVSENNTLDEVSSDAAVEVLGEPTQLRCLPSEDRRSSAGGTSDDGVSDDDTLDEASSDVETEELRCLHCENRGSSAGVTVSQRICTECQPDGLNVFVRHPFSAATLYLRGWTGAQRRGIVEQPENSSSVAVINPNILHLGSSLQTADLSTLPVGAPSSIHPAHRGTLAPFLTMRREGPTLTDAPRNPSPPPQPSFAERYRARLIASLTSDNESAAYLAAQRDIRNHGTRNLSIASEISSAAHEERSDTFTEDDEMDDGTDPRRSPEGHGADTSRSEADEPPRRRRRLNRPEDEV